jgi:hypothetical protein
MLRELIAGLILTAIVAAVGAAWKWNRDRRDSKKIYDFMLRSIAGTTWDFRRKGAISSKTNISTERVMILCTKLCAQGKLIRNEKEKALWKVS